MTRFSLKPKCNTEAVERCSLVKNATLAFTICFLVISIDDGYGEEDDDDYESKDMGVHDMDPINELILPTLSNMLHTGDETEEENGRLRTRQTKPKKKAGGFA